MPAKSSKPKTSSKGRHTQAVIIIHGMGEQRPMETLRSFADAILPDPKPGDEKYFSRPDSLSESFELRVLQNRSQPRTRFFEYYWQDKVSGTSFSHVVEWLSTLLLRRPKDVPKPLIPVWVISWLLLVVAFSAGILGLFERFTQATTKSPSFIVSLISLGILSAVQWFILKFVGDVARYLNPSPGNIKIRQDIRADGIKLLKKIHEDGEYERVIVVGHSLGSFVAYDILKHVWQEYHKTYSSPAASKQESLKKVEKLGEDLRNGISGVSTQNYMEAQIELWKELRSLGNPWLVTDFITMGSPLAHSYLVLAKSVEELKMRQRQRELPTNPPEPEIERTKKEERRFYSYRVWDRYGEKKNITLRAIHSAGLFAITRWTNIYFSGDLAGGPIKDFGPGIHNIEVKSGKSIVDHTILAHTSYWNPKALKSTSDGNSIEVLRKALDIESFKYFLNEDKTLDESETPVKENKPKSSTRKSNSKQAKK